MAISDTQSENDKSRFRPGARVWHPAFGLGEALRIESGRAGGYEDGVATRYVVIRFDYDLETEHRIPDTQRRLRLAQA